MSETKPSIFGASMEEPIDSDSFRIFVHDHNNNKVFIGAIGNSDYSQEVNRSLASQVVDAINSRANIKIPELP